MEEEKLLYKVVPYYVEKRGNLKMLGINCPVEYKNVKGSLVIHIKDRLTPIDMELVSSQLKVIFGEPLVLFALEEDISFFITEPMSEAEIREFKSKSENVEVVNET